MFERIGKHGEKAMVRECVIMAISPFGRERLMQKLLMPSDVNWQRGCGENGFRW